MKTTQEVAEFFNVTSQTVRNWVKSGKIEYIKIGRGIRIPEEAIEKILKKES